MNRKICMILCACFLMSCMVVPASAAEVSGFNFIDVLDYGGVNGGTAHSVTYSGTDVYFTLPYSMPIGYIDMVVAVSGVGINSCTLSIPSGSASVLSMVSIGNGLYRIYGFCNLSLASQITFTFGRAASGNSYITFHSIKLSSTHYLGYQDLAFFAVNGSSFQYMPGPGESVSYSWSGIQDKEHYVDYKGYIYLQNWKKYDVLDVTFQVDTNSFTAISANLDGVNIPMELSYFDLSSDSWYSTEVGESTTLFHSIPRNAMISARLDLSGVDRSSGSYVQIVFSGTYSNYSYDSSSFKLYDYWGFVELENDDSYISYWFKTLNTRLLNLTSTMQAQLANLRNELTTHFSTLTDTVVEWYGKLDTTISTWLEKVDMSISTWGDTLNTRLLNLTATVQAQLSNLRTELTTHFSTLTDTVVSWYQTLNTTISTWGDTLNTRLLNQTATIRDMFLSLNTWIINQTNALESAIRGDTGPGDAFQDEVDEKDQQLDDMAAVMDSVNKPALDSINVDVSGYVSSTDVSALAAPLLVFITGDVFGPIIIMSILLATVSYALFGKRG